ncbi:MAG: TIGR00366 family protein [Acutalibacteraceae bacterium]|nr:TIGR00366 family protein [Acutalibacteraceae bacterium]
MAEKEKGGLNINVKSFITAIVVIFALMVGTYILTMIIPGGEYAYAVDANGNTIIDVNGYSSVEGGLPFWKWVLSPILVLGAEGNGTLIAVIAFLLVIGGIFNSLDKSGLMKYMLDRMVKRFGAVRYRLLAIVTFFFMAMGAMIGSFEEVVPLVPIVVALAVNLGWNSLIGVGMSILAAGCGFAAGVCNPFTIGVAQELAGLPMFSGAWLRVVSFVLIYALLLSFLVFYAKRHERPISQSADIESFTADKRMDKGLVCFVSILGAGILTVLCSGFISALQDYTMIIVAVMFLFAGVVSTLVSGMKGKVLAKTSWQGVTSIFPAVLMILMASSIKYTLEEANILDTILHEAVGFAADMPKWSVILFIYLIVLVMNFFIPSGSAKAFMLIPLIVPMAQIFGLSAQLCVVAFAFGDGFSNVFYPTNPVLLISLGLADVSYSKWVKFSWKFQITNLILTSAILLFGLAVGY